MLRKYTLVVVALLILCNAVGSAGTVENLLKDYGRNKGLCVWIGAGGTKTAGLPADLAEKSGLLIHCIAFDSESLDRLNTEIGEKGVAGQVLAEMLDVGMLPYVDNLVNLLIVENSKGVKKAELQRVTAPGGKIAVFSGGKFKFETVERPKDMGIWPLPVGDPGWNRTGDDKAVPMKPGLRWQDGVPINFTMWAACRGYVVNEKYCFSISAAEAENLNALHPGKGKNEMYLVSRDAYSGLPLWKINTKTRNDGKALTARNPWPIACDDTYVYAFSEGNIIGADGETGKVVKTFPAAYQTRRLLLKDGVLAAAGWENCRDYGLWHPWVSTTGKGKLEVYDTEKGKKIWEHDGPVQDIVIDGNTLFALVHSWGQKPKKTKNFAPDTSIKTTAEVIAFELNSGNELWRSADDTFRTEVDPWLCCAGSGVVAVARCYSNNGVTVLDGKTGKRLWKEDRPKVQMKNIYIHSIPWAIIVNNEMWLGGKKVDPKTGKNLGQSPIWGPVMCTPPTVVQNLVTSGRRGDMIAMPGGSFSGKDNVGAARAACIEGFAVANGSLYTGQNNCQCSPQHIPGFMAFGKSPMPQPGDFTSSRNVVKGTAFGKTESEEPGQSSWPMFLGSADRSSCSETQVSAEPKTVWKVQPVKKPEGALKDVWASRARECITAPTIGYGKVFAAALEDGRVFALDLRSGKELWSFTAGGRIDTPPTLADGMALFGSRNGWVFALRQSDGELVWKARVAPMELRMVAFGQVESLWPVPGSVLVSDGIVYASAGKTSENNGGLAFTAMKADTGSHVWAKSIGSPFSRQNDLFTLSNGKLMMKHLRLDPKTGAGSVPKTTRDNKFALEGLADGTWVNQYSRRSGDLRFGKLTAQMLAWDDKNVYGVSRERGLWRFAMPKGKAMNTPKPAQNNSAWFVRAMGGRQFESMILAGDTLVMGGRKAQGDTLSGYVELVDITNGKGKTDIALASYPVYQGIAAADGRLVVCCEDGSVVCLGQ